MYNYTTIYLLATTQFQEKELIGNPKLFTMKK